MPAVTKRTEHNLELQSLRGIAAFVVMIHHALRTLEGNGWAWAASEYALNSHGAVIVFFVLSGYVLTASLMRRGLDSRGIFTFYVRRAFRIYPALWVGITMGLLYMFFVQPLPAGELSQWASSYYRLETATVFGIVQSLLGLHNFLLPTAWTITVELCASALLPLIVLCIVRWKPSAIPLILLLLLVSAVSGASLRQVPFFFVHFCFGALIAIMPPPANIPFRRTIMVGAVCALFGAHLIIPWESNAFLIATIEALAAAVLVMGLTLCPVGWLRARWLVSIGDWSYSIYLLHLPIAFAIARLMDNRGMLLPDHNLGAVQITIVTVLIVVPASALVYRTIELPGIGLGNQLLKRWHGKLKRSASPSTTR